MLNFWPFNIGVKKREREESDKREKERFDRQLASPVSAFSGGPRTGRAVQAQPNRDQVRREEVRREETSSTSSFDDHLRYQTYPMHTSNDRPESASHSDCDSSRSSSSSSYSGDSSDSSSSCSSSDSGSSSSSSD